MLSRRRFLHTALWTPHALMLMSACGARPAVWVTIDHGPIVKLGEIMTFKMTATSGWDAPSPNDPLNPTTDAQVGFAMTPGLVPVGGSCTTHNEDFLAVSCPQQAVFRAKVPQEFHIDVRLEQPGEQAIKAIIYVQMKNSSSSDGDTLYLQVSSNSVNIQRTPFNRS